MGQILSDAQYFTRRVGEEAARCQRSGTRFSIAVFTSRPGEGELPEVACVRSLPQLLASVRQTDTVCRIDDASIAVLLIDADGEGSRSAALRLLERMEGEAANWLVRVFEYPERELILVDVGLRAAA